MTVKRVGEKTFGRRGDNEQAEEVWEDSSSPEPDRGPEEGKEEEKRNADKIKRAGARAGSGRRRG